MTKVVRLHYPEWADVMGGIADDIMRSRMLHADPETFRKHVEHVLRRAWAEHRLPARAGSGYVAGLKVDRWGFGSCSVGAVVMGPRPPSHLKIERSRVIFRNY